MRYATYGAGLLTLIVSLSTVLAGSPTAVPEIDGASLSTGLGLLSGSLLILKSRWGSK